MDNNKRITVMTMAISFVVLLIILAVAAGIFLTPPEEESQPLPRPGEETTQTEPEEEAPSQEEPKDEPEQPAPPSTEEETKPEDQPASTQPVTQAEGEPFAFAVQPKKMECRIQLGTGSLAEEYTAQTTDSATISQATSALSSLTTKVNTQTATGDRHRRYELTFTFPDGSQREYIMDDATIAPEDRLIQVSSPTGRQAYATSDTGKLDNLWLMLDELAQVETGTPGSKYPELAPASQGADRLMIYSNSQRLLVQLDTTEAKSVLQALAALEAQPGVDFSEAKTGAKWTELEMRAGNETSTLYQYVCYENGIAVQSGSTSTFYPCSQESLKTLMLAMRQAYQNGSAVPSWLGIMSLEHFTDMQVYCSVGGRREHAGLVYDFSTGIFQALQNLHVEKSAPTKVNAVEEMGLYYFELEFDTDVQYRIAIEESGSKLLLTIESSDMKDILQYTLVDDAAWRMLESEVAKQLY